MSHAHAKTHTYRLDAQVRSTTGTAASRRLRRLDDRIPAVIYGGTQEPLLISLSHNEVSKALQYEGVYSHILTLNVDGQEQSVVLKDMQRHPYKPRVLHMDFLRILATESIQLHVPLHFDKESACPGLKAGGIITHHMTEVEVRCFPKDLPEFLPLDLSSLALDSVIHLSDIPLPAGVELVDLLHHHDKAVVSVHRPRVQAEDNAELSATEEGSEETAASEKDKK